MSSPESESNVSGFVSGPNTEVLKRDPSSSAVFLADDFALVLPAEWWNETIYRMEGPERNGHAPRVVVAVNVIGGAMTAVDFAQMQLDRQGQSGKEWSRLDEQFLRLDTEARGYWVVFAKTSDRGLILVQDQLYLVQDGVGYRMTVTQKKDRRAEARAQIERMFRSFEPRSPLRVRRGQ